MADSTTPASPPPTRAHRAPALQSMAPAQQFEHTLHAFADQLASRSYAPTTVAYACRRVRAITRFLGIFPWEWTLDDLARFQEARRKAGISVSSRRLDDFPVRAFCTYLTERPEDLRALCFAQRVARTIALGTHVLRRPTTSGYIPDGAPR